MFRKNIAQVKKNHNLIQNLIIFIFLIVLFLLNITSNVLEISDELWNFQNVFKMANGLIIYKDCNVIITPIFFYIGMFLLKIFGNYLFIFRIYNLIIYSFLFFSIYKLFKTLKINRPFNITYLSFILLQIFSLINAGANYNTLAIAFSLIGITLIINKKNTCLKQGFILFLIFITKQNLAVYYFLALLIIDFTECKFSFTFIKKQISKLLFFVIPTSFLCLIMYFNGYLFDFLNLTFGGLFEFGSSNFIINFDPYLISFPLFSIILIIIVHYNKSKILTLINNDSFHTIDSLFIFTICMSFIIFPIINSAHVTFAIIYHLIFIFYIFYLLFNEILESENSLMISKNIIILILTFIFIRLGCYIYSNFSTTTFINDCNSPYFLTTVRSDYYANQNEILSYIKEEQNNNNKVIIFSSDSAYYSIQCNNFNGFLDLVFSGNLGYNGTHNVKNFITNNHNIIYLINSEPNYPISQEIPELIDFIKNNFEYKGTLLNYSIYQSN